MPDPKRWPINANAARKLAIDAAEDVIDLLIELAADIAGGKLEQALERITKAHRLLVYIIKTLIEAKYGEAPEQMPEEVVEDKSVPKP